MFRIVTDTSANLPTDYLHTEQITVIPYTFQSGKGEQSCMDLTTFDAKDFYAQMRSGVKVTTSQIPPQRYIDVLTPLLEAGEDVLFVSMSSGISGSYASGQIAARQLREEFPDRKFLLVDTYSASLGEGLLVMRAADCRREGLSIDETYKTRAASPHGADLYRRRSALSAPDGPPVQSGSRRRDGSADQAASEGRPAGKDCLLCQAPRTAACRRGHCQAV